MQTPADGPDRADERIERLFAAAFGMSSEQFRHKLQAEFDQASPEQQAEFEHLVGQANAALPGLHAAVDRIGETLTEMNAGMDEMQQSFTHLDARMVIIEKNLGVRLQGPAAKLDRPE